VQSKEGNVSGAHSSPDVGKSIMDYESLKNLTTPIADLKTTGGRFDQNAPINLSLVTSTAMPSCRQIVVNPATTKSKAVAEASLGWCSIYHLDSP